jgi:hypothetical protein
MTGTKHKEPRNRQGRCVARGTTLIRMYTQVHPLFAQVTVGTGRPYAHTPGRMLQVDSSEGNFGYFVRRQLAVIDCHSLGVVGTVLASSTLVCNLLLVYHAPRYVSALSPQLPLCFKQNDGGGHGRIQ